jgi:hypothetical protein
VAERAVLGPGVKETAIPNNNSAVYSASVMWL